MSSSNMLLSMKSVALWLAGTLRISPVLLQAPRYPQIRSEGNFLRGRQSALLLPRPWRAVDLGSGAAAANPFGAESVLGIDIGVSSSARILQADLAQEPMPLPEASVEIVTAHDFLEHVPRVLSGSDGRSRFPLVELMNEIHRVLKPGGLFYARTPCFPYKQVFQDPTHVNIMTEDTIPLYFCDLPGKQPWACMYGFDGSFSLVRQAWCGFHLLALLRKN